MNKVITISRQFGSGGRMIGKEVTAKLGIPCYDSGLILKIAEKSELSHEYIKSYGEHVPSASWWGNILTVTITVALFGMICGAFSTMSSPNWLRNAPALSWAGAPTLSCGTPPTA